MITGFKISPAMRVGVGILAWLLSLASVGQEEAHSAVYDALSPALFVIESVERVSRSKNSVGSGFAVRDGEFLVTNYHVVSSAFLNPEQYALRAVDIEGLSAELEVLAVDPIHDLAVMRPLFTPETSTRVLATAFAVAEDTPSIGDTVLAMGNPLDIGLSVVPGTYNGLLRREFRPHIHFTGALNPGMSGGPAVNTQGEVIGINVAGAGNSVSFLVPVSHLSTLLENLPIRTESLAYQRKQFATLIGTHQSAMIDDLLAGDWELQEFGPLMIPKEVQDYVNCTGAAQEQKPDTRWEQSVSNCTVSDRIFLSGRLDTGPLEMFFALYESDELSPFQFADLFSRDRFYPPNRGRKEDVTEFDCLDRWTSLPNMGEQAFKASYCLRTYMDYPGIYDVLYIARAMPTERQGLHIHYTLSGVPREAAARFHVRMLENVQWK